MKARWIKFMDLRTLRIFFLAKAIENRIILYRLKHNMTLPELEADPRYIRDEPERYSRPDRANHHRISRHSRSTR